MIKFKLKKSFFWLPVIAIGIILGFSLQFVRAWVEPTVSAPNSNIGAPINTGSQIQIKGGQMGIQSWDSQLLLGYGSLKNSIGGANGWDPNMLYVNGWGQWTTGVSIGGPGGGSNFYANNLIDLNNGNYYLDPNGTSRMNYSVFDNLYSYGWEATPINYDSNDWNYYSDPNGTSRMNYGVFNNLYSYGWMQATWFPDANDNNYYVDPNGTSSLATVYANDVYLRNAGRWASQSVGDNLGNHSATTALNMNWNNIVNTNAIVGTYFSDANNGGYYVDPNNTSRLNYGIYDNLYSNGWIQSPIYYDANNTGFYIDPNGTSKFNNIQVTGSISANCSCGKCWATKADIIDNCGGSATYYMCTPDGWATTGHELIPNTCA